MDDGTNPDNFSFCPKPVNMSEITNLVTRHMEIEEILVEVHNTSDSESYWVEDFLAEKEEIKEKLLREVQGL